MRVLISFLLVILSFCPVALSAEVLTLEQAIKRTKQDNLDIKISQARLVATEQSFRKALSFYLPNISASGAYVRNSVESVVKMPSGYAIRDIKIPSSDPQAGLPGAPTTYALIPTGFNEAVIQPINYLTGAVQVSQAIILPAAIGGIMTAQKAIAATRLGHEQLKIEMTFVVTQTYYTAASLKQMVLIQNQQLISAKEHEKDAQLRQQAGTLSTLAVLRAQMERSKIEQDLKRAENSLEIAKLALKTLLQLEQDFDIELPSQKTLTERVSWFLDHPLNSQNATQNTVQNIVIERLDVRATLLAARAAHLSSVTTILKYLPQVFFNAKYNISNAAGFSGRNDYYTLSLALQWNIWDGGLRDAELSEARAKEKEALLLAEQTKKKAQEDIERSVLEVKNTIASLQKAKDTLNLAKESARIAEDSFKAQMSTYLEVGDARQGLVAAQLACMGEQLLYDLAVLKLEKALQLQAH